MYRTTPKKRLVRALRATACALILIAPTLAWAARNGTPVTFTPAELAAIQRHTTTSDKAPPDPTDHVADNPRAAAFGQYLFFDRQLSINGKFSCASCHQPKHAFTDGRRFGKALGVDSRNTPTLLNAADNHWFFLDGRAGTMWSQALDVLENPRELGNDRLHLAHTIYSNAELRRAYQSIFGQLPSLSNMARFPAHGTPKAPKNSAKFQAWQRMSPADRKAINRVFANVGKVIEAYERKLIRRGSLFDRYAKALRTNNMTDLKFMPPAAQRGLKLFVGKAHCDLCHSGKDFTDGAFHNIGLPKLAGESVDTGREQGIRTLLNDPFNAAGAYSDAPHSQTAQRLAFLPQPKSMRGAFKTPTLRNVARTAPYFHDGRFATLKQVINFYARGTTDGAKLIGKRERTLELIPHLTSAQVKDIAAFLKTLNSRPLPSALTKPPAHPWPGSAPPTKQE